jgi:hypothetical protein
MCNTPLFDFEFARLDDAATQITQAMFETSEFFSPLLSLFQGGNDCASHHNNRNDRPKLRPIHNIMAYHRSKVPQDHGRDRTNNRFTHGYTLL